MGQRQGNDSRRRPPRRGDEHRPRARTGLDRQPCPRFAWRRAPDAAVEPYRLALEERQCAVPPAGRRHLALRPGRWPQAPAGRRHLRRPAGRREIRACQYDQHRALPLLGGARHPGREIAADRQGRHRQECGRFCPADPGGTRAATPARSDPHLIAVRPRLRVQHLRPAGRLRVSAAPGARLSAELSGTRYLAARPSRGWRS